MIRLVDAIPIQNSRLHFLLLLLCIDPSHIQIFSLDRFFHWTDQKRRAGLLTSASLLYAVVHSRADTKENEKHAEDGARSHIYHCTHDHAAGAAAARE